MCLVLGQKARAISWLLAKRLQLKMKFPYEKYLHFASHLVSAPLRCFPRDVAFLRVLPMGAVEMESSGVLVPLLAVIFPCRSNVTGNRYFSMA